MLAGSHHLGRLDHFLMGDQSGADPDKVEMAKKFYLPRTTYNAIYAIQGGDGQEVLFAKNNI